MSEMNLRKVEREHVRWLILSVLDAARPVGTNEEIILKSVLAAKVPTTQMEIRRELDYLAERGLLEISGRDSLIWFAKLTRYGVDVVEYTVPVDPGIARPAKWW